MKARPRSPASISTRASRPDALFREPRARGRATASWPIDLPRHCAMDRGESEDVPPTRRRSSPPSPQAIGDVEHDFEFVVIDTPASDSYLMRLAHSLADTLVSPLNDSFIDVDVFSRVHHDRERRGAVAQYADLVLQARRKRRIVDNGVIDWVMVRNRIAALASINAEQVAVTRPAFRRAGLSRRRRLARPRHLPRIVPHRPDRARPHRGGGSHGALTASPDLRPARDRGARRCAVPADAAARRRPSWQSRRLWRERVLGYYRELRRDPAETALTTAPDCALLHARPFVLRSRRARHRLDCGAGRRGGVRHFHLLRGSRRRTPAMPISTPR